MEKEASSSDSHLGQQDLALEGVIEQGDKSHWLLLGKPGQGGLGTAPQLHQDWGLGVEASTDPQETEAEGE